MPQPRTDSETAPAEDQAPGPRQRRVLVIDDAPDMRAYLRALLHRWGYEVELAADGISGLGKVREGNLRLVVCDWMMPGMSGPEVCAAVRRETLKHYVYILLLTGRSDNADLVRGLDAGADDFVGKPFDTQVLRARLTVAERILALEDQLADQNRRLRHQRDELEQAYARIQSDLAVAAKVQHQLLPVSDRQIRPWRAGFLFLPAATVSGDNFNFFLVSEDTVGFYHLDVSGHGIPAALMSASLSRSLVPGSLFDAGAHAERFEPSAVLGALNEQLLKPDDELISYATIACGRIDMASGQGQIAIAAHPRPLLLRADGRIEVLDSGGLPVGMFAATGYEAQPFVLEPGDRLLLYSDGVTDCTNPDGEAFETDHLYRTLGELVSGSSATMAETLAQTLRRWRGNRDLEDDISVLIIERPAQRMSDAQQMRLKLLSHPEDPDLIAGMQADIRPMIDGAGLDAQAAGNLLTAVTEAVNNIIEHAYDNQAGMPITLKVRIDAESIRIELRDRGRRMPQPLPSGELPHLLAEGGRGWYIIRKFTDGLDYRYADESNILTLIKQRPR